MTITPVQVRSILTRTSGYLAGIASHSLQPYRGCGLGNSLCGVGCYVRHNPWITKGRAWGSFVEARANAAAIYEKQYDRERTWARSRFGRFGIYLSSSTEPFQPAEQKYGVTRSLLTAMLDRPTDLLIVQTHSHHVVDAIDVLKRLNDRCTLRVHVSIETDRDNLPGLPRHASPVAKRIDAGRALRAAGIRAVATVAPLLPIDRPEAFFRTLAGAFDAIVVDHFIGGDGSSDGSRTRRTPLPIVMQAIDPASVDLVYRERMVRLAKSYCPNIGVGQSGFAGRYVA